MERYRIVIVILLPFVLVLGAAAIPGSAANPLLTDFLLIVIAAIVGAIIGIQEMRDRGFDEMRECGFDEHT